MRFPWDLGTRSDEEWQSSDQRVKAVRSHLRILLNELEQTLSRIEHQRRGMASDE